MHDLGLDSASGVSFAAGAEMSAISKDDGPAIDAFDSRQVLEAHAAQAQSQGLVRQSAELLATRRELLAERRRLVKSCRALIGQARLKVAQSKFLVRLKPNGA
jgi:hypothetical protein